MLDLQHSRMELPTLAERPLSRDLDPDYDYTDWEQEDDNE
jgi:hypothetical protein